MCRSALPFPTNAPLSAPPLVVANLYVSSHHFSNELANLFPLVVSQHCVLALLANELMRDCQILCLCIFFLMVNYLNNHYMTCKSMACSACSFHTFKLHVVLSVVCEIKRCLTWAKKRWVEGAQIRLFMKHKNVSSLLSLKNTKWCAEMFIVLNFYVPFTHLHKSNIVCIHTFVSYKSICRSLWWMPSARTKNSPDQQPCKKGSLFPGKKKKIWLLPFHMCQVDVRNRCKELHFAPACIERPR